MRWEDMLVRKEILDLAVAYNISHIAPAFSCTELITFLYEHVLTKNDKFILSKGHGCLSLYVALRHKGYNPSIKSHPDIERKEGIECTTGSLGHGLPMGVGMALAKKITNTKDRVFVLMSDGECEEGTTWESLLIATQHHLDNLCVVVDYNKLQALDRIVLSLHDLKKKFESFNCSVVEIDGHDFDEISKAVNQIGGYKPLIIIAHTIKGKGVSFMENKPEWHTRIPQGELLVQAYKELEE